MRRVLIRYFCRLNASEQRELSARMERKQMKEFMQVRYSIPQRHYHSFSTTTDNQAQLVKL